MKNSSIDEENENFSSCSDPAQKNACRLLSGSGSDFGISVHFLKNPISVHFFNEQEKESFRTDSQD